MRAKVLNRSHKVTPKCRNRKLVTKNTEHRVSPKGNGKGVVLRRRRVSFLNRVSVDEGVILRKVKNHHLLKIDT
jgi:hypothetical protein